VEVIVGVIEGAVRERRARGEEDRMSKNTKIEWSQGSWNPVTGCTGRSEGCRNCYARSMALRQKGMGRAKYANGFEVTLHESELETPLKWKKSMRIFAISMGDLFNPRVPVEFIRRVHGTIGRADWHTFVILTKWPERALELADQLPWPGNLWMGTSIETNDYVSRADHLRLIPAAVKVLSLEPFLGPVPDLDLTGIDWVITGGESGSSARRMDPEWVRDIRDRCVVANIAFFLKQWGGKNKKKAGRVLDGRTWDQYPVGTRASP